MTARPDFRPGRNIAMKVPAPQYDATVAFYQDVVGLESLDAEPPTLGFRFGDKNRWIDRCPGVGQSETWLELVCDDLDEVESLGAAPAFWISSPASVVHLVCRADASWA